jgi:HK97 family phage major capsid protein
MSDNLPAETPLLKRLNEQRIAAAHARKEYLERAAEGEELSAEDNAAFTKASRSIDHYGSLIKDEIDRLQNDSDLATAYEAGVQKINEGRKNGDRRGEEKRTGLSQKMREDLEASKRGETRNGGAYQEIPEHRDLVVGTSNVGGATVPVTLVDSLYQKLFDDSAVLQAGPTILRTASGESLKLPRLTSLVLTPAGSAFTQANSKVAEAGPILEGEPRFDQVQLDAYKYAQYTQVSRELVEDSVLDIEALLGQVLGRNMANFIGYDLTLGTGTGEPRGVRTVVQAGAKVTGATGVSGAPNTTDFDQFFDVIAKLKPGYRRNAKWMTNDINTFSLRKLKMGSVYAWEPNLQTAGAPDTFLGYPLLSDPNMPAFATTAGVSVLFGDFSAYYVRMVKDVRIEWSMEFAWVNDLLSVKAVMRADGDAIDDDAFAAFVSAAS